MSLVKKETESTIKVNNPLLVEKALRHMEKEPLTKYQVDTIFKKLGGTND